MPQDSTTPTPNTGLASNARFTQPVLKNLSPEICRAAEALWANYEALDLEVITTLEDAEPDFLAAMPVIDGFEDEINQLVKELIEDVRMNFKGAAEAPLRLRFAYQNEDELISNLLPHSAARLVVMPVDKDISLHANVKESM